MEPKIEAMSYEIIEAVIALEQECRLCSRSKESYLELLQDETWLLLAAIESSNIIAIFSGQIVVDELQVDNIAVAESFRQEGVATSLLKNALEIAKQKGIKTAFLETRSGNSAALKLYERHGFTIIGRRKNYYQSPPDDAVLMLLNLGKHS